MQTSTQDSSSTDPRYPIGRFQPPAEIDRQQLNQWIDRISELPALLRSTVIHLNESQLNTPYREAGWTVRQVVHHVADSHMNSYARFRLALTEDTPVIKAYSESKWAELSDARLAAPEVSLRILDALHERWVMLLRAMTDSDYKKAFRHPERGEMRLDFALGLYAWHGAHHVSQIRDLRQRHGW